MTACKDVIRRIAHAGRDLPNAGTNFAAENGSGPGLMRETAMEQSAAKPTNPYLPPRFMEHRWGQRMPCRAVVRISDGKQASGAGRVRDISSSGAFIETALDIPVYARIALSVLGNESAAHAVELSATVVRVDRDGFAVEWCETPDGEVCGVVGCITRCAALNALTRPAADE
jgi:hypothetical protein